MKKIIVTAADETFSELLIDLLDSLEQWRTPLSDSIGILDLGLSEASLSLIKGRVDRVVVPQWDLKIDAATAARKPYLRAITARPFLREYFPGYGKYMWLDADTWVQGRFAVNWLFEAAKFGIGVISEVHHSYRNSGGHIRWRTQRLKEYFQSQGSDAYFGNTYFNAGVFAMSDTSPHWKEWGKYFQAGLDRSPTQVCDQTALNYAIWNKGLAVHPLPASCNWCCHLASPVIDLKTLKFREPHIPYQEIGIIHMIADTKDYTWNLSNTNYRMSFRYRSLQKLKANVYFDPSLAW